MVLLDFEGHERVQGVCNQAFDALNDAQKALRAVSRLKLSPELEAEANARSHQQMLESTRNGSNGREMTRNRRAGVEDRWRKADGTPSAVDGKGMRWRARYVDDQGREHARGFRTKVEANRWLETIVSAQVTGTYVDPKRGQITFGSFYRDWSRRQVWVAGTRDSMDYAVRSAPFADVALADLRASHIETWVKSMQDRGLAPLTIHTYFVNVRTVIRAAVRERCLPRDVGSGVRLPRQRKASAAMTIPTPEQVRAAIAVGGAFAALVAVCGFAGLRIGEANALKVSDVDFLRREIQVSRQVQWDRSGRGRVEIRAPKYGSERTVYIPDGLVVMLAEHVRNYCPGDDPDRWLFPDRRNQELPIHQNKMRWFWRSSRAALGISYRLHDLRHFYASGLIRAGCDVVTVQRALGHSSAAITLTTYSHLWPDPAIGPARRPGSCWTRLSALLRTLCGRMDRFRASDLGVNRAPTCSTSTVSVACAACIATAATLPVMGAAAEEAAGENLVPANVKLAVDLSQLAGVQCDPGIHRFAGRRPDNGKPRWA